LKAKRIICWFSCGAASAVATKILLHDWPKARPVYCETGAEHPDNIRFITDCESWFGKSIERLKSNDYEDTWDVWTRRKYLAGISGAPCSVELKIAPRLIFQKPTDIHAFGYTADASDIVRATRFRTNYPEVSLRTPLIERGLTKSACLGLLRDAGIKLPAMYDLGFHNNNCIPCVKATSPAYWSLVRQQFPDDFDRMAKLSRQLGARLCRLNNKRAFIDEIPEDHPTTQRTSLSCDFLCQLAKDLTVGEAKKVA
jgi:hypothetical protein